MTSKNTIRNKYLLKMPNTIILVFVIISLFSFSCTKELEDEFTGNEILSPDKLNEIEIAPIDEALSFARYTKNNSTHLMAVLSYSNNTVSGIDLTAALSSAPTDPVDLFNEYGYDAISAMTGLSQFSVTVPDSELLIPVDLIGHHIAAGVNFPEHADETGVTDGPFLFAKIVEPTSAFSDVPVKKGLLDYEAEIGFVVLEPLAETDNAPDYMGLILCNDYTNREVLLNHINAKDLISGDGFTEGKSFPGYLPVGNLFVIPKDYHSFSEALELKLYVNDQLRQQSVVSRAIWQIDDLIEQTWARKDKTLELV
jgi:2,4-diketo-3-deoxy-L-fuconate hydrolase